MDKKELKTSLGQRIFIMVIAIIMVGSFFAVYAAIILGNSKEGATETATSEELNELQEKYSKVYNEVADLGTELYLGEFKGYKTEVKGYNEEAANNSGLQTRDLKEGSGRELTNGDINYYAYYIGWCADETVFDSSFDNFSDPTSLKTPLSAGVGLIEGWNLGVEGMRLGGTREITIPGELAYGNAREICGGYNKPLKFIVMTVPETREMMDKLSELEEIETDFYGSMK